MIDPDKPTATLRFVDDEVDRVNAILARAYQRNQHASRNDVLKEMMGLTSTGLLTKEDRAYLRLGGRNGSNGPTSDFLDLTLETLDPPTRKHARKSRKA